MMRGSYCCQYLSPGCALMGLVLAAILLPGCGGSGRIESTTSPEFNSVGPPGGFRGSITQVVITGSNFQQGADVLIGPDPGITVTQVRVVSPNRIEATFEIAPTAPQSLRNIVIVNPNGESVIREAVFQVFALGLVTVTGVQPNRGARGGTVAITISGSFFQEGATVFSSPGILVAAVTVNSIDQITATLVITDSAAPGLHSIAVVNPNGIGNACDSCFLVTE